MFSMISDRYCSKRELCAPRLRKTGFIRFEHGLRPFFSDNNALLSYNKKSDLIWLFYSTVTEFYQLSTQNKQYHTIISNGTLFDTI